MYKRILYTSRATELVNIRDVYEIIRKAQLRNSKHHLTGCLVFMDGHFIQALEGPPNAVEERYAVIMRDRRHADIALRKEEMGNSLLFQSEWMALRNALDIPKLLLEKHRYEPGFPAEKFSADSLLAFLVDCFHHKTANC